MGGAPVLTLPHLDPIALDLVVAVHTGDLDGIRRLLDTHEGLATAHLVGRHGGWRTPLHVVTDWPGHFPAAPAAAGIMLEAGADVNADTGGDRPETPLHWAASTDDVHVAVVLIAAGARLDTPGGSIGTPLANAVGYGRWHVARLLVARGAPVDGLGQAAALGLLPRLEELLAEAPTSDEIDQAFWQACHGGQRRAAERLLVAGARLDASPDYANGQSAIEAATAADTQREALTTWLKEQAS